MGNPDFIYSRDGDEFRVYKVAGVTCIESAPVITVDLNLWGDERENISEQLKADVAQALRFLADQLDGEG